MIDKILITVKKVKLIDKHFFFYQIMLKYRDLINKMYKLYRKKNILLNNNRKFVIKNIQNILFKAVFFFYRLVFLKCIKYSHNFANEPIAKPAR